MAINEKNDMVILNSFSTMFISPGFEYYEKKL